MGDAPIKANLREFGPGRCSMCCVVTAETIQTDADVDLRGFGVTSKLRGTLADMCDLPRAAWVPTRAAGGEDTTNRLSMISKLIGATQTTIDNGWR